MSETRTRYVTADPDYLQSEQEFQSAITDLADLQGLLWYHPNESRRDNPGFPDLAIADPAHGVLYLWELKTMRGRPSDKQREWAEDLGRCYRLEYGLWRPSDWPAVRDKLSRDSIAGSV